MKPSIISRIIAAALFGVLLGIWTYHGHTKVMALGRDEFLKGQAANFDMHSAHPLPAAALICGSVMGVGITVGVYELVAFGICKLLEKTDRRSRRRRHQY